MQPTFHSFEVEERVREAEECGDTTDAERMWLSLLESLVDCDAQALLYGQCFAGLGRCALANSRAREALVYLEKAEIIFLSCDDKGRASEARHGARQCRAVLGEFLACTAEFDMVQFCLRLAQFELAQKHFTHCRLALECADALNDDPFFADAVDKMRRKLAKASGSPISSADKVTRSQAIDALASIEKEDMGSIWRRSWTPYMITLGFGIAIAGFLYVLHSPSKDES